SRGGGNLWTSYHRLKSVVIAIEFVSRAEQPLFAHAGERRFARDAPYPGNNRRQRRPAEQRFQRIVLGAGLKRESFGGGRHSPFYLQRPYPWGAHSANVKPRVSCQAEAKSRSRYSSGRATRLRLAEPSRYSSG